MKTITDDAAVPGSTILYHSKIRLYIKLILGVLFLATAIYTYFIGMSGSVTDMRNKRVILYLGPSLALLLFYQAYKGFKNNGPQLTLNSEGIRIADKPLMHWEHVSDVEITWGNIQRLNFKYDGENIKVNFETFPIKPFELRNLIKIYRERHLKKSGFKYEIQ